MLKISNQTYYMQKLKAQEMNRLTAEEYAEAEKIPFVVVLDNIRSMHNIGAVFRTADAFRIEKIYLCGICCCPPNSEIHKTALGAELTVEWRYFKDTHEAITELRRDGYTTLAIEQARDSVQLDELNIECGHKYAIVLGHEVFGVQQEVVDMCDLCIEIPQYGTKHSLNVSVAAGIVMYEISKQLLALK